jgi:hypothetical protein
MALSAFRSNDALWTAFEGGFIDSVSRSDAKSLTWCLRPFINGPINVALGG